MFYKTANDPKSLCEFQTFRLLDEEGFFVGASSGLNVSAAYQLAKQMGPGHTIVTCLCDTGQVSLLPCSIDTYQDLI